MQPLPVIGELYSQLYYRHPSRQNDQVESNQGHHIVDERYFQSQEEDPDRQQVNSDEENAER